MVARKARPGKVLELGKSTMLFRDDMIRFMREQYHIIR